MVSNICVNALSVCDVLMLTVVCKMIPPGIAADACVVVISNALKTPLTGESRLFAFIIELITSFGLGDPAL